ncbi:oligopeptide transport ATP-binding protein OppF [Sporolactobacillus inulinus]|uniref:Oligopeptide transport ATP-binding protein OppF n=1 Tax=Sporolactobacillus inulinus TaxID=2078 RepID=A0A4Y1ZCZ4_9BACL|nr:oligopeptide transport ATP-binding protein OppF [Sporolactobacillus inulinus]
MSESLLHVENLKKYYPITGGKFGRVSETVRAVDGVSFRFAKVKH